MLSVRRLICARGIVEIVAPARENSIGAGALDLLSLIILSETKRESFDDHYITSIHINCC